VIDVLASEWAKLWSLRSTYLMLAVAAVTSTGIAALVAVAFATTPAGQLPAAFDALSPGLLSQEYAVIAAGVLGVLTFATEFGTGLIRTTFAAVPRRGRVLMAKACAAGGTALVLGEALSFVTFLLVQAVLGTHGQGVSLADAGIAQRVLANGLMLAVSALLGVGLGAVLRHTASAVATCCAVIFLPGLLNFLPSPYNARIGQFTLLDAAQQVSALHPQNGRLSPGWSLAVLLAWPAAALVLAAAGLRRDA
jgi:ABC-2 type transport system permease protein